MIRFRLLVMSLVCWLQGLLLQLPARADELASRLLQIEDRFWDHRIEAAQAMEAILPMLSLQQDKRLWIRAQLLIIRSKFGRISPQDIDLQLESLRELARRNQYRAELALVLKEQGEHRRFQKFAEEQVRTPFEEAAQICEEISPSSICSEVWERYAYFEYRLGNHPAAIAHINRALSQQDAERHVQNGSYHHTQMLVASMLEARGEHDKALDIYRASLEWTLTHRYRRLSALIAYSIGMNLLYTQLDQHDKVNQVLHYFQLAEQQALGGDDARALGMIYMGFGDYYMVLGDQHQQRNVPQAAQDHYRRSLEYLHRAWKTSEEDILVLLYQAEVLIRIEDWKAADAVLEQASARIRPEQTWDRNYLLKLWVEVMEGRNDYARAFALQKQLLQSIQDVNAEEQKKQVNALSVELGLKVEEERRLAIQRELELQQQKQQAEKREQELLLILMICLFLLVIFLVGMIMLRYFAKSLERQITRKTRQIRLILDHVPIGICTISGSKLETDPGYSSYLEQVVEDEALGGRGVVMELINRSTLGLDQRDQICNALHGIVGSDQIAWELNAHLLPALLEIPADGQPSRFFELTWSPVVNDEQAVERVLVTLHDITELRQLEKVAHDQDEELHIIQELLAISPDVFRRFVWATQSLFRQIEQVLNEQTGQHLEIGDRQLIVMNLHTVKGSARSLHLRQLTEVVHSLESELLQTSAAEPFGPNRSKIKDDLQQAIAVLQRYMTVAEEKLGQNLQETSDIMVSSRSLYQVAEILDQAEDRPSGLTQADIESIQVQLRDILKKDLAEVLKDIIEQNLSIAKDLQKPIPHYEVRFQDIRIYSRYHDLLSHVFVHLVRNAIDHGIEIPQERLLRGKPSEGFILIEAEAGEKGLTLLLTDDGRGLHLGKLQCLAESLAYKWQNTLDPDTSLADLIFQDGISTAETVTDISGRGMGLAAVRRYLREHGGDIAIELRGLQHGHSDYQAFSFRIELPAALCGRRELSRLQEKLRYVGLHAS